MFFGAGNRFTPFLFWHLNRKDCWVSSPYTTTEKERRFINRLEAWIQPPVVILVLFWPRFVGRTFNKKQGILAWVPQGVLKQSGCPIWIEHFDDGHNQLQTPSFLWRPPRFFLLENYLYTPANFLSGFLFNFLLFVS